MRGWVWLLSISLQGLQELFDRHLRLPKNILQNRSWQIKAVVTGNGDSEVRFFGVPQLSVTPGLVMDFESCPLQRPQDFPGFQNWKSSTHLGRDSQFKKLRVAFARNFFSVLLQAVDVAANGVLRHLQCFILRAPKSDQAGQRRHGHLKTDRFEWIRNADSLRFAP
jgi:hypothetical protein